MAAETLHNGENVRIVVFSPFPTERTTVLTYYLVSFAYEVLVWPLRTIRHRGRGPCMKFLILQVSSQVSETRPRGRHLPLTQTDIEPLARHRFLFRGLLLILQDPVPAQLMRGHQGVPSPGGRDGEKLEPAHAQVPRVAVSHREYMEETKGGPPLGKAASAERAAWKHDQAITP